MPGKYIKKVVPETTNNITTGIINFLKSEGHFATRINRTGIYDPTTGRFRKSNTKDSVLDIYSCLMPHGRSLWVDVKKGNDRPSKGQLKFADDIKATGGAALFVDSYEDFLILYRHIDFL